MFQTIVVPLDGSKVSEQALPLARTIAKRAKAALHVGSVHVTPSALYSSAEMMADLQLDSLLRDQENGYLQGVARQLGDVCSGVALLEGPIDTGICEFAEGLGSGLVVMTTHGRGALARFWLGSVADKLVRRTAAPVLLLRARDEEDVDESPVVKNILVPLDGSALAEEILPAALDLAKVMQAGVTLLRVVKPLEPVNVDLATPGVPNLGSALLEKLQEAHSHVLDEAGAYLRQIADRLAPQVARVETCVRACNLPAMTILEIAREQPGTVIALATHGRSGFSRMLLGSVADKVVRGTAAPVLLQRPGGGNVKPRATAQASADQQTARRLTLAADTAADMMKPDPVSIKDRATVDEALGFLTTRGFSAAPVIDESGRPVGVLSRSDLLVHARHAQSAAVRDPAIVRDLMTPAVFSVRPGTIARSVVEQMISCKVHRLYVVDAAGVLVGVISPLDVLQHLSDMN